MSSIVTRKMDFQLDPEIQEAFTLPTLHNMDLSDFCSTASSPMSTSDYSPVTSPGSTSTASPPISPTKQCLSPSSLSDSSSCGSSFEHSSTKKSTKSSKRQGSTTQRRNERERRRVKMVSEGFANLRKHVPLVPAKGKKLSKVETLRTAIEYIRQLQDVLQENDRQGERNRKCLQGVSFIQNSIQLQTLTQQNPYSLPRAWDNGPFSSIPGEITVFPSNEILYNFPPNNFASLDTCH